MRSLERGEGLDIETDVQGTDRGTQRRASARPGKASEEGGLMTSCSWTWGPQNPQEHEFLLFVWLGLRRSIINALTCMDTAGRAAVKVSSYPACPTAYLL